MAELTTTHFSKKILFVSILFMLVNLAWLSVKALSQAPDSFKAVAPVLKFASTVDTIDIKSPYDADFRTATEEQELVTGTVIRTGDHEFAELELDSNIVRLDENTEVTLMGNNFTEVTAFKIEPPRLVLNLMSGSLWINAFDTIEVKTDKANVRMGHSIGIVTHSAPMNRVVMATGNADLELLNAEGTKLTSFMVPLQSQVTFVDTQISPEYARLKYSKLKKELKLGSVSQSILNDEWIQRNSEAESKRFTENFELIQSEQEYKIENRLLQAKSWLTFLPESRAELMRKRASMDLRYLLGSVHKNEDTALATQLIAELSQIVAGNETDSFIRQLFSETFFAIGRVKFGSPAYLTKEYLMGYLVDQDGPEILRMYLADIRNYLNGFDIEDAEAATNQWMASWEKILSAENLEEYTQESQIFHRILLASSDKVPTGMLDAFDQTGAIRLTLDGSEENRFAVTDERLLIASSLVSNYRYVAAKKYLQSSYNSLDIENMDSKIASVKVFMEQAKLLAQRIEFAEDRLFGAAEKIDETEFQSYLAQKALSDQLSEDLKAFFQPGEVEENTMEAPTKDRVVAKFQDARIKISEDSLTVDTLNPFVFAVTDAYLMERSEDGSLVVFSASYDYSTNAVNQVTVLSKPINGSFALSDLVAILKRSGSEAGTDQTDGSVIDSDIFDLLESNENEDALRAKITSETLTRQLVVSELSKLGISIPDPLQVEALDTVTFKKFKIGGALIEDSITAKNVAISFEYNIATKLATNVVNLDSGELMAQQVPASGIVNLIEKKSYDEVIVQSNISKVEDYMAANNLILMDQNITQDENGYVELSSIRVTGLPLTVQGTFDTNTDRLTRLSHALYEEANPEIEAYFRALAKLYVLDLLETNGITIPAQNVIVEYPIQPVQIQNFQSGGKTYSFSVDLASNLLKDVVLQETGAKVASMTMAEFRDLLPKEETAPQEEETGDEPAIP